MADNLADEVPKHKDAVVFVFEEAAIPVQHGEVCIIGAVHDINAEARDGGDSVWDWRFGSSVSIDDED